MNIEASYKQKKTTFEKYYPEDTEADNKQMEPTRPQNDRPDDRAEVYLAQVLCDYYNN